jgi:hypothetical protein
MKAPFEVEWFGGAAERYFRKIRTSVDDLPWGSIDTAQFSPRAVAIARRSWTEVSINEYRAISSFSEVVRALADARAPLDLVAMASDFLADECSHVELASRVAMELGGGASIEVDVERMSPRPYGLSAFQRANELVLRISCIEEAFSGGTASVSFRTTTHPLCHAVYETILRDESHHRRLGPLYFEWAQSRLDDAERQRLGRVLLQTLEGLEFFWKPDERAARASLPVDDMCALGWLSPARFAEVSRDVVEREILDPLATIGIALTGEERALLLREPRERGPKAAD